VGIKQPNLFISEETGLPIDSAVLATTYIQPQISDSDAATISTLGSATTNAITTVMASNAVLAIVLGSSMQVLWGMIDSLQLITHLPLVRLSMPGNLKMFFSLVNDVLSFKVIDF